CQGNAVVHRDLRQSARPCPGDDVGEAVAVHVAGADADTAREGRRESEEVSQYTTAAAEDAHFRSAAGIGAADNVRGAVAVNVARGHEDAAGEDGGEREEITDQRPALAVEDLHLGAAAGTGRGDDVRCAVAVHVADSNPDPTTERRREREEIEL